MNRWKNYVVLAAALGALSVLGTFTAKPLLAQIKAALVQSVDEPGRNPYQSFVLLSSCNTQFNCFLPFTKVPAGKRLVATNVAGLIPVTSPGGIAAVSLGNQSAGPPIVPLATIFQGMIGTNNYAVNSTIKAYFEPNDTPILLLNTSGALTQSEFGVVNLSGYLVSVP
jgi:hypothetical protein